MEYPLPIISMVFSLGKIRHSQISVASFSRHLESRTSLINFSKPYVTTDCRYIKIKIVSAGFNLGFSIYKIMAEVANVYPGTSQCRPAELDGGGSGVYCCIPLCKNATYTTERNRSLELGFFDSRKMKILERNGQALSNSFEEVGVLIHSK